METEKLLAEQAISPVELARPTSPPVPVEPVPVPAVPLISRVQTAPAGAHYLTRYAFAGGVVFLVLVRLLTLLLAGWGIPVL